MSWFGHGMAILALAPLALSMLYVGYSQYRTFTYSLAGSMWRTAVFLAVCAVLTAAAYSKLADMVIR